MKTIVFTSVNAHFVKYQYLIGKKLEKKKYRIFYVTYSKEAELYLKERKAEVVYLDDEYTTLPIKSLNKLVSYDFNAERLGFEDQEFSKKRPIHTIREIMALATFWQHFLFINDVDVVIGSRERLFNRVPQIICKKDKVKYYWWTRAPIENRFILTENTTEGTHSVLEEYWKKHKNKRLNKKEKRRARNIRNNIIQKKKHIYLVVGKPTISLNQVGFFFKRLYLNIFVEKFRNPYAQVIRIAMNKVLRYFRTLQLVYDKMPNNKYFFYPLHVQDDAQILVGAPHFHNQVELVRLIARSLPAGYQLVVKEHPNNIGGTKLKDLEDIRKTNNVWLVHPNTNSHDIIENSSAIVTVNSNVGWEGLLYKKPVINLGDCWYECSGLTWPIKDLNYLDYATYRCLKYGKIDEDTLLRFVHAVHESSFAGNLNFYYQYAKKNMNNKNITLIARGIDKCVKRQKQ